MKIRNGFVSNSSSSSFVICKEFLTEDQVDAIRDAHQKWIEDGVYFGDNGDYFDEDDNYIMFEAYGIRDKVRKLCDKEGIDTTKIFWTEG